MPSLGNLFRLPSTEAEGERFDTLLEQAGTTIERIVSTGQASAPGFWYDSPRAEWVVLLSGAASLEFAGDAHPHVMQPGDYLLIEAHRKHRVAWTHDTEPTVWLAVHLAQDSGSLEASQVVPPG
ncbi:cupin domain-containing protein [Paraburkholderia phenazinium]|jgi:cupin 2 domain-containing protein|uniref:Cupin 2 domain-containing protein n=1 Tax=Paraburkholderia phenazinium TaxID=60549 RepID=A0A1G7YVU3_9BURK|nr:cupin domain-containing protein [Paraburkholderia phenazinium]SDH00638.1 cupin 2 domain-containing protein [Paraburkholderia phenazinium]